MDLERIVLAIRHLKTVGDFKGSLRRSSTELDACEVREHVKDFPGKGHA